MSTQVTINLPDHFLRRAERFAELTGRDIEDVIAEKIGLFLPPLTSEMDTRLVETLSDEEVVAVAEGMMDEVQSARMSVLLQRQQNEGLDDSERAELTMLMDIYSIGQLRKAQAMAEAVRRGLRLNLQSPEAESHPAKPGREAPSNGAVRD